MSFATFNPVQHIDMDKDRMALSGCPFTTARMLYWIDVC
jgi:hypothetical protein